MTDLAIKPDLVTTDDGDHDRFTHIVYPKSKLTEAIVMGLPVLALCKKKWVPGRDPGRFPLCPTCKSICEANGWRVPSG